MTVFSFWSYSFWVLLLIPFTIIIAISRFGSLPDFGLCCSYLGCPTCQSPGEQWPQSSEPAEVQSRVDRRMYLLSRCGFVFLLVCPGLSLFRGVQCISSPRELWSVAWFLRDSWALPRVRSPLPVTGVLLVHISLCKWIRQTLIIHGGSTSDDPS